MTEVPTEQDIDPHGDLDGGIAAAHFLGRTVSEVAALLAENSNVYEEDYMWMGPKAFVYYAPSLLQYLESVDSARDHDFAYGMISCFRFRLRHDGPAVAGAIPVMRAFCERTMLDFGRLEFPEEYKERLSRRIAELECAIQEINEN